MGVGARLGCGEEEFGMCVGGGMGGLLGKRLLGVGRRNGVAASR